MNARRLAVGFVLLLGLSGCGGPDQTTTVMPDVEGRRLDVALSDIKRAGFDDKVEVVGGGTFGVIDESNWKVCDQLPAAGQVVTEAPRLTVERSCDETSPPDESGSTEGETEQTVQQADHRPKYGQTAESTVHFSTGTTVQLAITVSAPIAFTPSDPADATQAAAVYFNVTITNSSNADTFTADVVVTQAICGLGSDDPSLDEMSGKGTDGDFIVDFDAGIIGVDGAPEIEPGKSITFKDGYSVACADDVTYKIQPAGLAGDTLYFQK